MDSGPPLYSSLLEAAVRLAAQGHHRQLRKRSAGAHDCTGDVVPLPSDCVPYLTHLMATACILARLGERDEVVAAGLLHDYLEDVPDPAGRERIRRAVGDEVLGLVLELTERGREHPDAVRSWPFRKQGQLDRIAAMPREAVVVKAADLLHNLSSLLSDLKVAPSAAAVWSRFNAGPGQQLWYYRSMVDAVRERLGPHPLVEEVDRVLFLLSPSLPPPGEGSDRP